MRTNDTKKTEVRSRAILGKDGYFRSISIGATEYLWKQNEKTFEKMLNSLDQAKTSEVGVWPADAEKIYYLAVLFTEVVPQTFPFI